MSEKIEKINVVESTRIFEAIKKDAVTDETLKKLEELGIDPSTIKTETEAQQRIKEAESAQANTSAQPPVQSLDTAVKNLRELAEKIGIHVEKGDDIQRLTDTIDRRIREFEKQVENDIGTERKEMVESARRWYREIKNDLEHALNEEKKVTKNLEMMATYNVVRS
ncbi:hypothetical protein IJ732_08390 [bacterium]|nr:hypothetical protein [bacterium]